MTSSRALLLRWVFLFDIATVALVVMSGFIFAFGGFREFVGEWRVSIRSWDRVLLAALLVTALRHARQRHPWIGRVVWDEMRRVWQSSTWRAVGPAWLGTRIGVLAVGWLAVATLGIPPELERFRISDELLTNLMARWDAQWYLGIASEGYSWDHNPQRQQTVVFFPAYPLSMRVMGWFVGRRWLEAGLLLALVAFAAALSYMYRLARELMDTDRARTAVWTLAAYPFAVYYSAPYTESYYLLGSVAAFFHFRRGEFAYAAAWGLFVGLCRPNGFFIGAPLALLALEQMRRERRLVPAAWAVVLSPAAGVALYSAYLAVAFGDPLAWLKGQAAWGRVYAGLGAGLQALFVDRYRAITGDGFTHYVALNPYDFLHTLAALFVLTAAWPCIRRFGAAYGVFILVNIVPPLVMGGMMSIGRMTSVLFPAFLWLGAALPPRAAGAVIAGFCVVQGLIAVLFFTWRPVF